MSKKILIELTSRASELRHRNAKQKDELMADILNFINSKKITSKHIDEYNKISFDYTQFYKGWHPPQRLDEQWKKGHRDLLIFLNNLKDSLK